MSFTDDQVRKDLGNYLVIKRLDKYRINCNVNHITSISEGCPRWVLYKLKEAIFVRQSAEKERESAEKERESAEKERQSAEQEREYAKQEIERYVCARYLLLFVYFVIISLFFFAKKTLPYMT